MSEALTENSRTSGFYRVGQDAAKSSIDGYIIDITYSVRVERPILFFTVKTMDGEVITVEHYGFRPYCYLRYSTFADVERIVETVRGISGVTGAEIVKISEYGKRDIQLIKVYTDIPKRVGDLRKVFLQIDGVVEWEEADIPFVLRFITDTNVRLCVRMQMDVVKRYKGIPQLETLKDIRYKEDFELINFKCYAFDIECYNPDVVTKAEKDAIICIGVKTDTYERMFSIDQYKGSDIDRERRMLSAFIEDVNRFNPDILISYNGIAFDIPYLVKRCERLGLTFAIGSNRRAVKVKDDDKYGKNVYIPGRICFDAYIPAKRDIGDLPHKTLKDVADYAKLILHEERVELPYQRIWRWWDAGGMRREVIKEYCLHDTIATYLIGTRFFLTNMVAISAIARVPLPFAMTQRYGSINTHIINSYLHNRGMLIPKKDTREGEDLKGAEVLDASRGVYENVEAYDFKSMYPSIMMKYNLSPETLVLEGEVVDDSLVYVTAGGKYRFRKDVQGIIPLIAWEFMKARAKYRKMYKGMSKTDPMYGIYEALQLTYKRLANALYGMTGQKKFASRYYFYPIADSITWHGRNAILTICEMAEKEFGKKAIYGDTDSVYLTAFSKDEQERFVKRVFDITGLEIERDYGVQTFISEGKKKRYFFLRDNGDLVVRGYEYRRGDWIRMVKQAEEELMRVLLTSRDADEGLKVIEKYVLRLREGRFEVEDVTIYKTLKRDVGEYDESHSQVHVAVAEREFTEYGVVPEVGEKNGVVIVEPDKVCKFYPQFAAKLSLDDLKSKLKYRAVLASRITDIGDLDIEYYIDKQFATPLTRILDVFGVKKKAVSFQDYNMAHLENLDVEGLLNGR